MCRVIEVVLVLLGATNCVEVFVWIRRDVTDIVSFLNSVYKLWSFSILIMSSTETSRVTISYLEWMAK